MAGRGRGRGRGVLAENRPGLSTNGSMPSFPGVQASNEPLPVVQKDQIEEICRKIIDLKLNANNEVLSKLSDLSKKEATSDDRCMKIIDTLYEKVFMDNEFAAKVAEFENMLCSLEEVGGKFRSCLLRRAQEHYKNRENLKKKSSLEWTGLICVLCEIFKVLRISGSPLKPLTGPIYEMLGELLQSLDNSDMMECFHGQFRSVGKMLNDLDKEKMDNLISKLRDSILSDKSTPETRCLLTELLELQASNWSLSQEVQRFYCDAMADILASQD